ncbi:Glycopeptide antibiotics resistance protein [Saccharopolyspora antimicrobica]|uniref:Glycopeptide antibiotics resistance protein n=1 Tax=Saccharopolyspora antimicrobica TaxID=455193 RepID=A0A1I5KEG8_9PSEU|nr:VanZ family protein [Saccharopolyspora antimicrobica]RKT81959.1 glycopeptide antibiotics resistance protein [Saccharopolyspora antimicrobica]SFO83001.1 Glycopeptide antibiotics resistance protein [Saccharopolyspora antimicrobica]
MSTRLIPAVVAIVLGALLAIALFVPYVARQYRRRGELGIGNAALALGGLVYSLGLIAYVLLPMPAMRPDFCAVHGTSGPQWIPFNFLTDMEKEAIGTGIAATLRNPALTQVLLNVALFLPLGMFVRYMFQRSVLATTAIGLGVSLLIELTQVTGIWFLYPCAYRLFDVDDLMANGLGALLGAFAAPLLRAVPGQRIDSDPGLPRPVTRSRRLLAMVCDLMAFQFTGAVVVAGANAGLLAVHGELLSGVTPPAELAGYAEVNAVTPWLPWFLLAVVVPLAGKAPSLGQRIVRLQATRPDGRPAGAAMRLLRSLFGVGGYVLLSQLSSTAPDLELLGTLGSLYGLASLIALFTTDGHRGLSYVFTGLRLTDSRAVDRAEVLS